ncbi:MAG: carboxypeptidase [Aquaticitalea sp.]
MRLKIMLLCTYTFFCCGYAFSQATPKDTTLIPVPDAIKSITKHSVVIDGKAINYTATAGALILTNEKNEPIALFGYTAYTKDDSGSTKRPVTFSYNGGPGSSSYWLHIGVIGPRKIVVNDPEYNPPPPYKFEDNTNSILDVTDIVMIDPVGTGLSHAVGKAKNKDFWGVDQDIKSISNFIKQYVTDNNRWNSPKFLLGESYGTLRSAGVVDYLQENLGMVMNGVILVSSVLDLRTLTFQQYDDLSYILHLPTYAATAWYHNKISNKPEHVEDFIKDSKAFAEGEYASALMKGDHITDAEKESILNKLAGFTGLSTDYLLRANLRVTEPQFTQELLRSEHMMVGRLDSRYKGISQNLLAENAYDDPQSSAIGPIFTTAFLSYYYGDLKMDTKYNYHTSAYDAEGFSWDWKHGKSGGGGDSDPSTPNTVIDLVDAMSRNPSLKILVLNGYYDLATPFYATEYTFEHLGLEKILKSNIELKYYAAGHMMYINSSAANAFKKDVAGFILNASK